jgi:hypothetical protein
MSSNVMLLLAENLPLSQVTSTSAKTLNTSKMSQSQVAAE